MDLDADDDLESRGSLVEERNGVPDGEGLVTQEGTGGIVSQNVVCPNALMPPTQISTAGPSRRTPGRKHVPMPQHRANKGSQRGKGGGFKKRRQVKQVEDSGSRGGQFFGAELDYLLDSVDNVLPADFLGWNHVCEMHNEQWAEKKRMPEGLRRKFNKLHGKKPQTGNPFMSTLFERTKAISMKIAKSNDVGGDLEDDLDMPNVLENEDAGIHENDVPGASNQVSTVPTDRTSVPVPEVAPSSTRGDASVRTTPRNLSFNVSRTPLSSSARRPLVNRCLMEDRRPAEPSSSTSQIMEVLKVQLAQDQHKAQMHEQELVQRRLQLEEERKDRILAEKMRMEREERERKDQWNMFFEQRAAEERERHRRDEQERKERKDREEREERRFTQMMQVLVGMRGGNGDSSRTNANDSNRTD